MKYIKKFLPLIALKYNKEGGTNMKLPIILIVVLCVFIGISYTAPTAANCSNPNSRQGLDECESLDFSQEIDRISKTDIAKHSAISNYCLHFDTSKDSIWKLLLYERIAPLPTKIQKKCEVYSISIKINLEELFKSKGPTINGGCITTCTGNCEKASNKCSSNLDESYSIYDDMNYFDINYCFKNIDVDKISRLFNKYIPIKWELEVSCNGVTGKIPTENNYIYISGICNEEQLKKNRGYDKYKPKEDENL
jgi:hypothetical protein